MKTAQIELIQKIAATVAFTFSQSENAESAWRNAGQALMNEFGMSQECAAEAIKAVMPIIEKSF